MIVSKARKIQWHPIKIREHTATFVSMVPLIRGQQQSVATCPKANDCKNSVVCLIDHSQCFKLLDGLNNTKGGVTQDVGPTAGQSVLRLAHNEFAATRAHQLGQS